MKSNVVRSLIRLFVIFVVLLFAAEIFTRSMLTLPVKTMPDKELGWVYQPHAAILHTSEGNALNRLNSLGFNDDEPVAEDGRKRVLLLGDSITEALQVERRDNFASLVDTALPCVDIFNGARSGLSPVHYPVVQARLNDAFRPDMTVLVISSGDAGDLRKKGYRVERNEQGQITRVQVREKPPGRARALLDPLLSRSAFMTYAMYRVKQLMASQAKKSGRPKTSQAKAAADDVSSLLDYLFRQVRQVSPVAILYIHRLDYLADRVVRDNPGSVEFSSLVGQVADELDIPLISNGAHMRDIYTATGQPGAGFANKDIRVGHLNEAGHRGTAEALEKLLADNGFACGSVAGVSPGDSRR